MVRKNNILAQIKGAAAGGLNPEENYKGNWDCAKKILRNHGLRGMYSGYLSTLLRDMQVGRSLVWGCGGGWVAGGQLQLTLVSAWRVVLLNNEMPKIDVAVGATAQVSSHCVRR
jgi:hypothetical protein